MKGSKHEMNNQEGQFMSPNPRDRQNDPRKENEYIPRPINSGTREQQQWQEVPPPQQQWQGIPPQQPMFGEKLQPQQRGRRGSRGCVIALIAVVVILALAGTGIASFSSHFPFSGPGITEAKSFTVSASPRLIINDPVGIINVHTGGAGNQVAVSTTKQSAGIGGKPQNIHITYQESSDQSTVTINVDESSHFLGFNSVAFNITVPGTTNLDVHTDTGAIDVSGINGQMSLTSNTGVINATQDNLTASSTMKTDTGAVTFNGTIAPTGAYQFETNTGSVDITLPGNTSFHLNASTDTGSFNSKFPGVNAERNGAGSKVNADVGSSPNATLTLKTDTGSINLNPGQ